MTKTSKPTEPDNEAVVLRQIAAYNARDIEAFLALYSPDAEIIRLPGSEPCLIGYDAMRDRYAVMFAASPDLRCEVEGMWAAGAFVALRESISGMAGQPSFVCLAIYQIEDSLIRRLWLAK